MAGDKTDYWGRISKENDKSFEETLDQTYMEYHYHPTYIPHYNTSKSEDARTAELDAQTESLGKQDALLLSKRPPKRIWVNGLPGPVSSEPLTGGAGGRSRSKGCVGFFAGVAVLTMLIMIVFAVMANIGGL